MIDLSFNISITPANFTKLLQFLATMDPGAAQTAIVQEPVASTPPPGPGAIGGTFTPAGGTPEGIAAAKAATAAATAAMNAGAPLGPPGGDEEVPPAPDTTTTPPAPDTTTTPPAAGGVELDTAGIPWDARIHAGTQTKVKDGTWKKKPGIDKALYNQVIAELNANGAPKVADGGIVADVKAVITKVTELTTADPDNYAGVLVVLGKYGLSALKEVDSRPELAQPIYEELCAIQS